jgi:hypothetical protein
MKGQMVYIYDTINDGLRMLYACYMKKSIDQCEIIWKFLIKVAKSKPSNNEYIFTITLPLAKKATDGKDGSGNWQINTTLDMIKVH